MRTGHLCESLSIASLAVAIAGPGDGCRNRTIFDFSQIHSLKKVANTVYAGEQVAQAMIWSGNEAE